MPVCHRRKLAFCHIPRTGGVSIVRALKLEVIDKHYPASFYREKFPDYTLFSVLRAHDDRVNSAHGWKPYTDNGNFGLMTKPNEYFLDCDVDYLLRFDHLEEDLNAMLAKEGFKPVKLQHTNSFRSVNIIQAIQSAEKLQSQIDKQTMKELVGLSSPKVRHLLNNLVAQSDTYLEVGSFLGGTLRAALHGNDHVYAAAVDNFSMMPNTRQMFFDNTAMLTFDFFEDDCLDMDVAKIKRPVGLYFCDGLHTFEAQQKALIHFYPARKDDFVYVCDDWLKKRIPNATFTIAKDLGLEVMENYDLMCGPRGEWWHGIGVIRFKKTRNAEQN